MANLDIVQPSGTVLQELKLYRFFAHMQRNVCHGFDCHPAIDPTKLPPYTLDPTMVHFIRLRWPNAIIQLLTDVCTSSRLCSIKSLALQIVADLLLPHSHENKQWPRVNESHISPTNPASTPTYTLLQSASHIYNFTTS